jgi:hypothetical protein
MTSKPMGSLLASKEMVGFGSSIPLRPGGSGIAHDLADAFLEQKRLSWSNGTIHSKLIARTSRRSGGSRGMNSAFYDFPTAERRFNNA